MNSTTVNKPKNAVVLLVEDSPADQLSVERVLEDGYVKCELHIAENGIEALEWLSKDDPISYPKPDLILMDINMPVLDGLKALKAIRADIKLKKIPVIILTTSDSEHDREESYNEGANAFITKPMSHIAFYEAVVALGQFQFELVALPDKTP